MKESSAANDKPYEIIREIAEIKQGAVRSMRLNLIRWNGKNEPVYDLRWWKIEDGVMTMYSGSIQLTREEARKLRDLLIEEGLGEED